MIKKRIKKAIELGESKIFFVAEKIINDAAPTERIIKDVAFGLARALAINHAWKKEAEDKVTATTRMVGFLGAAAMGLLTNSRLRRFLGLFWPIFDFLWRGNIRKLILPLQRKSKSWLKRTLKSAEAEIVNSPIVN